MFRYVAKQARKAVVQTTQRRKMGGSALSGDAKNPHYADFGYGADQMLPFHEIAKNPIPYRWKPMKKMPLMVAGHHPELKQHQMYSQATGHGFSLVPGIDYVAEAAAKRAMRQRISGVAVYLTLLYGIFRYERFMWDGLQFPQQPIWDEMIEANYRALAYSIQWEKTAKEIQNDTPMSEIYGLILQRPFFTNNPYRFNEKELQIADDNISYRAFEPALQKLAPEEYRTRANYIMFYVELSEKLQQIAATGDFKNAEEVLSQWLFTQNKYSQEELQEIMAVASKYNDNFTFHRNAIYDKDANEVVYFSGRHWAQVEENLKPQVPSMESTQNGVALALAGPLLVELIKSGPVADLRNAFTFKVDGEEKAQQETRGALWNFLVMDSDKETFNKLLTLQRQVLASSDNSLRAFQENAKGLNLPVPNGFSISAINHAIAKKQFATMDGAAIAQLSAVPDALKAGI